MIRPAAVLISAFLAAAMPPQGALAQQPSIQAGSSGSVIHQGDASFALADHPQKILFVKTDGGNAKDAIADLLLSDIGLNLITMGMASQMKAWNPYLGDTLGKMKTVGKGLLHSRGSNTQGFEYATLSGTTAAITVVGGKPELLIPITRFAASADVDLAAIQPVLLKLESRQNDQLRVLTTRHVLITEAKKGRFDFKPAVTRQEDSVEQNAVPIDAEFTPDKVYRIVPKQDLAAGEYALVFRSKSPAGDFTADVPLKPARALEDAQNVDVAIQPQGRRGFLGRGKPAQEEPGVTVGFLAWDFRVMR